MSDRPNGSRASDGIIFDLVDAVGGLKESNKNAEASRQHLRREIRAVAEAVDEIKGAMNDVARTVATLASAQIAADAKIEADQVATEKTTKEINSTIDDLEERIEAQELIEKGRVKLIGKVAGYSTALGAGLAYVGINIPEWASGFLVKIGMK